MAAAIRDATPTGDVHRIQVTRRLMAALKVCTCSSASVRYETGRR